VQVNGRLVDTMQLSQGPTDLIGDLDFDTTAGALDTTSPFPVNFPAVGPGEHGPDRDPARLQPADPLVAFFSVRRVRLIFPSLVQYEMSLKGGLILI
jgi:hypothetical protein